ncbi:MAG: Asp-tRNA(Asn)/Glu-tRNA(Gln) amidotransferase subunit GatB [SAR202 cluster bacterium]|jgi:aspartyl-tRNA(Asn)/glutamyl-tRNA(Gln) amidotransferase subunit B|nr:Asp-tRNA(Asn)/Glu-tRNA(Gln) amidotransferase subunit GatB [SAR202 cluster bacterium]|tara:strand:- start:1152 stop:2624 length:1473 start_codon:yes stop_codon:yes gene_type:complete
MEYEVVIGLEVHAQLLTNSKMFCGCSSDYQGASPNSVVCPVCMGMPGVLPVINRKAVEHVIRTGLALGCDIAHHTKFDRKNYPYPDLMKGYQISQFDMPIASGGSLTVNVDGQQRTLGITRVHLEEDTAKLIHRTEDFGEGYSLMDINRAGAPLMEIVGEPDIRSAEEARQYLIDLHSVLQYIDVSTANMEEGNFRCDANISIRPVGTTELGSKVEVKNMNSFRSVFRALEFEAMRQLETLEGGGRIVQETRGWVDDREVTVSQRTKEYASDYRYFPEPDLPLLVIQPEWVDSIRESLPELPRRRMARFVSEYGLSEYDAELLTTSKASADYFERSVALGQAKGLVEQDLAKSVSNWLLGEMARLLNQTDLTIDAVKIGPDQIVELQELVDAGTLNSNMAKDVFEKMFATGGSPKAIAEAGGLVQISDSEAVSAAVAEAIAANPQPVQDYIDGKETAIRFLVGQVMKATRGKANPQIATEMLKDNLEALK